MKIFPGNVFWFILLLLSVLEIWKDEIQLKILNGKKRVNKKVVNSINVISNASTS